MGRLFGKKPAPVAKTRGPITRESLAANRMNPDYEESSDQEDKSSEETPQPEFRQEEPHRKIKKKPWFRRSPKRVEEAPAIQINRPTPEAKHRVLRHEVIPFFNSLGWFILAYLTIYLLYQGFTILAAGAYNIDSVLYYYEVYFPVGNASPLWTRLNIIVITFIGPLISLIAAIVLLRGILPMKKPGLRSRIYFVWVAWFGIAHFFGAFVGGIITNLGFGYVANWLYMNVWFKILVSLIFLFIMAIIAYHSARFTHETIPPAHREKRSRLRWALASRFIFPTIVGILLLLAVRIPNRTPQHENIQVYDAVIICSMIFMAVPAFFNRKAIGRNFLNKTQWIKRQPGIITFILALLLLTGFRLLLSQGLYFLIRFSFEVGLYQG